MYSYGTNMYTLDTNMYTWGLNKVQTCLLKAYCSTDSLCTFFFLRVYPNTTSFVRINGFPLLFCFQLSCLPQSCSVLQTTLGHEDVKILPIICNSADFIPFYVAILQATKSPLLWFAAQSKCVWAQECAEPTVKVRRPAGHSESLIQSSFHCRTESLVKPADGGLVSACFYV